MILLLIHHIHLNCFDGPNLVKDQNLHSSQWFVRKMTRGIAGFYIAERTDLNIHGADMIDIDDTILILIKYSN